MPNFNFKIHSFREIPMEFWALAPLDPSYAQSCGCRRKDLLQKFRSLRYRPRSLLQKPRSLRCGPKFTSRSRYFEKAMKRKPRLRRVRSLHGKLCFYMILFRSGPVPSASQSSCLSRRSAKAAMPLGAGKYSSPYSTTGFFSVPIPSIMHSTTSPGLRNLGGSKPIPTPAGVPVAMMVPAFKVMPRLSSLTTSAIP